ncbi:hypothetical protein KAR91_05145 [Candidatus Pacearchaeota archaeon]|nr:hypothetical protein [Candidatus Pacearchaeota archaeon]
MKEMIMKWLESVKNSIVTWVEGVWGKIVTWVKSVKNKIEKSGKMKWLFAALPAIIGGIAFVISIFNKEKGYNDDTAKKIKKAKKHNDRVIKSSRSFLRKRTKFKRKKL